LTDIIFMRRPSFYILLLWMLGVGLPLIWCQASETLAASPGSLLKQADQCRRALEGSSKKKQYRHHWMNCIERYKKIYTHYPECDEAAWALYQCGRLYTGLSRYSGMPGYLDEALTLYRRLVAQHGQHRLADDAQYLIGEIFYKHKDEPTRAYVEYLKVDIKFPSGDMRRRARKRLDQLAKVLAPEKGGSASGLVAVKDIRHWSTPTYTRVVVDLEGPVTYEDHLLKPDPKLEKPRRLYLDLKNARVPPEFKDAVPIKDGLLQRARAGQYTKNTVRVVLDSGSIGGYKVFHLHDPFRIVVDVRRNERDETLQAKPSKKRKVHKGSPEAQPGDRKVSIARQLGLNVDTIVIDPGHGGKDPGCTAGGRMEKDIVMNMARLLAATIKKRLGCEVYLTRKEDLFLPLERRTAIANIKKADLFISLHVNAHRSERIWGLETYFLNMATDERAVMVAARENATSEKNISDLQAILNDLMLNTKIHESSRLAQAVQKGMVGKVRQRYKGVKSLGVKQAPFYVLIGAQMPAILVETGFLTNRNERTRLTRESYQRRIAEGICSGIREYIREIDLVAVGE